MLTMVVFNFSEAKMEGGLYKPDVEEESLTPFLTVQLIKDTPQVVGVKVEQPMPGSEYEQLYDPDAN